jgi:hypothetical protein
MPLPLFLAVVFLVLLGNVGLDGVLLWVAGRICKARRWTLARVGHF